MVALDEKSGDHQIIRIHILGTINICAKCTSNVVSTVVVVEGFGPKWWTDRLTDTVIP